MASATRPATVRERVADSDRSVGRLLLVTAGALFWGWLVVSWVNRWLGGVIVPIGQPLVPPGPSRRLSIDSGIAAYAADATFVVEMTPLCRAGRGSRS